MNESNIKLNEKYIIRKLENDIPKEQYVVIDGNIDADDGSKLYTYTYGHFGFHEGCCSPENIREMTDKEKEFSKNNEFWKLPQQFYQSFPE